VSGRTGLVGEVESNGLATFVSYFSLPALIFRSLATLAFANICWTFVCGILVSKILLFVVVAAVSLILTKPSDTAIAGLFGIFCTQSNDFAVGYPIISSLYAEIQPFYAEYLYVLAPIQLLVINPAGIFMMELNRQLSNSNISSRTLLIAVVCGVLKNPVIIMTVAGLLWNVLGPHKLPLVMSSTMDVLAQSFSAGALFLLGLTMVGKFNLSRGSASLITPVLLAVIKVMVLPLVIWFVLEHVFNDQASLSMANYGYLYGTLPSAPIVFVFAFQYGTDTNAVATALVLSTILAAPIMFVCGNMIRLSSMTLCSTAADLMSSAVLVSAVSLPLLLWTLFVLLHGRKWRSLTHRVTIIMILFQVLVNVSAILSRVTGDHSSESSDWGPFSGLRIRLVLSVVSVAGIRVWAAILAITLSLLHLKSLCFVIKFQWVAHVIGAVFLMALTAVSAALLNPENGCSYSSCKCTSYQSYLSVVLTVVCSFISFVGLITTQKLLLQKQEEPDEQPLLSNSSDEVPDALTSPPSHSVDCGSNDLEDITPFCARRKSCGSHAECETAVAKYQRSLSEPVESATEASPVPFNDFEHHQMLSHIILLITMSLALMVQVVVLFGQLAYEASTGVFLNMQYLNVIFVHGQGIFIFLIFGLNAESVYLTLSRITRKLLHKLRIQGNADSDSPVQTTSSQGPQSHRPSLLI
jgi:predicted permease